MLLVQVSSTDTVKELMLVVEAFELSPRELRTIVQCGFERSFFPGSHAEKLTYVKQVMQYYDKVAARHGIAC